MLTKAQDTVAASEWVGDSVVYAAFEAWLMVAQSRLRDGELEFYFDSCHFDEVGIHWSGVCDVRSAVDHVLRGQGAVNSGMRLAIAVPLAETVEPYRKLPTFDSLEADEFEPPSVYLFEARHFQLPSDRTERFRLRYNGNPLGMDSGIDFIELVSWRDSRGRSLDWPYSNTLWIWTGAGSQEHSREVEH